MGKTNVVCNCCYIILLFVVLFLFVLESKECSLAVRWTIVAQAHDTRFWNCCFQWCKQDQILKTTTNIKITRPKTKSVIYCLVTEAHMLLLLLLFLLLLSISFFFFDMDHWSDTNKWLIDWLIDWITRPKPSEANKDTWGFKHLVSEGHCWSPQ